MFDKENFMGLNGFVWWIGEVEDRVDPLQLNRCKVRIFGWHTGNTSQLPTEDLPWAQAVYPLNSPPSKSFGCPNVGDWVLGFFMDGENAQFPVMLGVFQGFKQ
jgi:hypothetical protein